MNTEDYDCKLGLSFLCMTVVMIICADEGACVFIECNSDDQTVEEEVHHKVMRTVTEGDLLPDCTANRLFPGVLVVRELMLKQTGIG